MDKKIISVILVFILLGGCMALFGCKRETIKFNRESAAANLINRARINSTIQNKNSVPGVIILKDEPTNEQGIFFGPKEIDFDIK